ncbi:cell wall hydrolase/autolysin [Clostridium sp. CAG:307]|nr:cell wall hydrolase/autolysin [Clostridium sp. CAG:307]
MAFVSSTISKTSPSKLTIVIDPGHDGIYDTGTSVGNYNEGDINLKISQKLKNILDEDYNVILTREDENFLGNSNHFVKRDDLNQRIAIINNSKCDLFISIHQNFFPYDAYHGAEVHYNNINSFNKGVAFLLLNSIKMTLNNTTREIKENNDVYILKHISKPGCLIECGFMSNKEELSKLIEDDYQNSMARAIKKGIDTYFEIMA